MAAFAFDVDGTLFDPVSVSAALAPLVPDAEAFAEVAGGSEALAHR